MTLIPTPVLEVGFSAGAAESDYLVFDDPERGLFDTAKFAPDDIGVDIAADARMMRCNRGSTRFEGVYARTEAGSFSALLDNNDRTYDPTYSAGPYFGELLPGRPVRLKVPYAAPSGLVAPNGGYASNGSDVSITGDIDIRVRFSVGDAGYASIISKYALPDQVAWRLVHIGSGVLFFEFSEDGTTSEGVIGVTSLDLELPIWIRATLTVDDGAGNFVATLWRSDDDTHDHTEVVWAEFSQNTDAWTGPLFDGTASVVVGGETTISDVRIFAAAILDGIGGTVVADPCFHWDGPTSTDNGDGTWEDGRGNDWSVVSPAMVQDPTTFPVWAGFADDWELDYPGFGSDAVTRLPAIDGVKQLQVDGAEQSPAGAGETTGARIARVLDNAAWPDTDRRISDGDATVQATTLAQNAWSELCVTSDSEIGELWITADGKVRFRSRSEVVAHARNSKATFGDGAGELPLRDLKPRSPGKHIRNTISAARVGGSAQLAEDPASQLAFGKLTLNRTDLTLETDAAADDWANYVLYLLKDPDVEIEQFTVKPRTDDRLWPQVLGREIGDRVSVKLSPPGGGDRLEREVIIRGIAHDITPDDWVTTFTCQDATPFLDVLQFDVGEFDTAVFGY